MEGLIFGILRYFNSRRKFTRVGLLLTELSFHFKYLSRYKKANHSYHYFLSNSLSKRRQSVKTIYHRKVWRLIIQKCREKMIFL